MSKRRRTKPKSVVEQKPQKLIDIIIPVFNGFSILKECLQSIEAAANGLLYNIIVVDNGSTEEPVGFYDNLGIPVEVIRNKSNLGFPRACNIGTNRKRSPLIFFLNSDVILDPGSLDLLVRELDNPLVGVAGMKLVFPDDAKGLNPNIRPAGKIQHIGLSINIHTKPIHHFVGWSEDSPKVNRLREVTAVTGAAMLTRRNLWTKIGGFDEEYGMGTYEDISYCLEATKLGYNIHVVPEARAIHYTGATAEKNSIGFNLQMNHIIFIRKYIDVLNWSEYLAW